MTAQEYYDSLVDVYTKYLSLAQHTIQLQVNGDKVDMCHITIEQLTEVMQHMFTAGFCCSNAFNDIENKEVALPVLGTYIQIAVEQIQTIVPIVVSSED